MNSKSRAVAVALLVAGMAFGVTLIACGRHPASQSGAPVSNDFPLTTEQRALLDAPDTATTPPPGSVSRENYHQQLDSLEEEIQLEEKK